MIDKIVNGIPTAPEVSALRAEWPEIKQGDFLPYPDIERIAKCKRGSHRWVSVTQAFRKQLLRELNLFLVPDPGKGFKVATNAERVHHHANSYKSHVRGVKRASALASTTPDDGLGAQEKIVRQHLMMVGAAIDLADKTHAKQITFPVPQ